jgi:hypothetical protein
MATNSELLAAAGTKLGQADRAGARELYEQALAALFTYMVARI